MLRLIRSFVSIHAPADDGESSEAYRFDVLILGAALMLWACVHSGVPALRALTTWEPVPGVTESTLRYSYEWQGQRYETSQVFPNRRRPEEVEAAIAHLETGSQVTVYVDPANPTRAALDVHPEGTAVGFLFFGLACALVGFESLIDGVEGQRGRLRTGDETGVGPSFEAPSRSFGRTGFLILIVICVGAWNTYPAHWLLTSYLAAALAVFTAWHAWRAWRAFWEHHCWHQTRLRLPEDRAFVAGEAYAIRVEQAPPGAEAFLVCHEEHRPIAADAWSGGEVHREPVVLAANSAGTLEGELRLPPNALPPGLDEAGVVRRRRWSLLLVARSGHEALFGLPLEPGTEPAFEPGEERWVPG